MFSGLYFDVEHFSGATSMLDDIVIHSVESRDIDYIAELIRRNIMPFTSGEVFSASVARRSASLLEVYSQPGSRLFVARLQNNIAGAPIACAGVGTLHGLPLSEGIGEIRDLVVDVSFRGRGIGRRLLRACLEEARVHKYRSLYLETSTQMDKARKLFLRSGFRPVTEQHTLSPLHSENTPCYFFMDKLDGANLEIALKKVPH
ncbi:MAG: GNAT family N-acetyltransferase [Zetaproteobacteria bacterium]|nr:GNAT family N-acetyltransferase [Zetaproteobacteria bacterium]